jgi:signal peptidase I
LLGHLLRIIRVEGDSMVPGLYDGDRLLAVRPGPWRPLRRGRIVVGRVPAMAGGDGSALFIKRVLALPGETARVPLDRLAALDSADSVSWGTVPRGELVGVVVGRLLPS